MGLRQTVFRASLVLALRQLLGSGISLCGVVLLVGLIGPAAYGTFVTASGFFAYLYGVGPLGIHIYLIRRDGELDRKDYDQAFTLLLLIGLGLMIPAMLIAQFLGDWIGSADVAPIALVMCTLLPLSLCTLVPVAKLERSLKYQAVASIELSGQIVFYVLSLFGAWQGYGAFAATAGFCAQDIITAVLIFGYAGYRPRLRWDRVRIREMLLYGFSYASSLWVLQLSALANPLIVGRFAGADAVGLIAFAFRILDNLSFVKTVASRVAIAAMSKVQGEPRRLADAVNDGAKLQLLTLSPIILAFSFVAPWILPRLFGKEWTPLLDLFPYLAIAYMFSTMVSLHSSALYVLKHNGHMALCNGLRTVLLYLGAVAFVPFVGPVGYGWAECFAVLSYLALYHYSTAAIGRVPWDDSLAIAVSFSLAMFWHQLGFLAAAGFCAMLVWPKTRGLVRFYATYLRELRNG